MSFALSVILILVPAGTPRGEDQSVTPEFIAKSIEKNYAKLECFIATCKIDHTYFNVKKFENKTAIYYVMDDNFKTVKETPEGKLITSLTKYNGIFDQYNPAKEKEPGMVWKRRLDQMPGMILDDPRSFGANALDEDYPKLLRTNHVIYTKKKDRGLYDVLLEKSGSYILLITFDSAVNFLPVRIVHIFQKNPSNYIQNITYEKAGEMWFFKSFRTKRTNKRFANFDELDAEKTDLNDMRIQTLTNLKVNNRSLFPENLFTASYPKGTIVRDALINDIYTIGDEK